jgi:hypothetical protein
MKENSRIRFNPVSKEIEVEGSESFVKAYFDKLQALMSGAPEKKVSIKKKPKTVKAAPAKKRKMAVKAEPGEKRFTNIDKVVGIIQGSAEGISTAELKGKTGLAELQIWSIVNRASKLGKIKKLKKGLYVGV